MANQGGRAKSGHTPVSNAPTELDKVAVTEEEVSQPPFEGEGFGRLQETVQRDLEGVEAVPGYGQMRAALTNSLVDPKIVLAAPPSIYRPSLRPHSDPSPLSDRPLLRCHPGPSLREKPFMLLTTGSSLQTYRHQAVLAIRSGTLRA